MKQAIPTEIDIRLAHAFFRKGDVEASLRLVYRLCDLDSIDAHLRMSLAQLLFLGRDYDKAIRVAYRSLRELWPSTEADATYVSLFLISPDDLPCKAPTAVADANAWVRLRDDRGDETAYWILGDDMVPNTPMELSSTSGAANRLKSRAVGELLVLRPHDLDAPEYEVVEVTSIWVQAFLDVLDRTTTRIAADPSPIQAIRADDDDAIRMLSTMASTLHQRQERVKELSDIYYQGKMPLATLGILLDISFRDAYSVATSLEGGLLVERGTSASLEASKKRCPVGDQSHPSRLGDDYTL